jgi:hypothetical protein
MAKNQRSRFGVERRDVLRGLATGLAGVAAVPASLPLVAAAVVETDAPASAGQGQAGAASAPPRLLDAHERATLESLSDLLVPGSVDAGVPDLLDRVAAVDAPGAQRGLLNALRAFEGAARSSHAARWTDLDTGAQVAILEQAATGEPPALAASLVRLRDRVAQTYFATEPGMRRLGWTPRSAWRELPTCDHSGDDHG